jgi:hypothetical protein
VLEKVAERIGELAKKPLVVSPARRRAAQSCSPRRREGSPAGGAHAQRFESAYM